MIFAEDGDMILAFFKKYGQDYPNDGLCVSTVDNLLEPAIERVFFVLKFRIMIWLCYVFISGTVANSRW